MALDAVDSPTESVMADAVDATSTSTSGSHRYRCEQCGESFKRQDGYNRHLFQHTGVHAFQCVEPGCGKAYTNRSHLLRHVRSRHIPRYEEPSHACKHPGCDKTFKTMQKMMLHFGTLHLDQRRYKCGECGEQFRRKVQLRWHSYEHTGQYPHRCEPCGENFTNLKAFKRHRCRARAIPCSGCDRQFERWSDMVSHRRLEHPVVHRCERCGKQFHARSRLKQHAQVHARDEGGADGEEEQVRTVFECPYDDCPRFYEHERNLYAHVRSKHESRQRDQNQQQHVCPVPNCGRTLATRQKLTQHRKQHMRVKRSKPARPKTPRRQPAAAAAATPPTPSPAEVTTDSEVESGVPAALQLLRCNLQRLDAELDATRQV